MMTIDEEKRLQELAEKIKKTEQALETKQPKLTWLWRIIALIGLALAIYANSGCTYKQTITSDGQTVSTMMQIDPQIRQYMIPVVKSGK